MNQNKQKVSFKVFSLEQKIVMGIKYPFLTKAQIHNKVKELWRKTAKNGSQGQERPESSKSKKSKKTQNKHKPPLEFKANAFTYNSNKVPTSNDIDLMKKTKGILKNGKSHPNDNNTTGRVSFNSQLEVEQYSQVSRIEEEAYYPLSEASSNGQENNFDDIENYDMIVEDEYPVKFCSSKDENSGMQGLTQKFKKNVTSNHKMLPEEKTEEVKCKQKGNFPVSPNVVQSLESVILGENVSHKSETDETVLDEHINMTKCSGNDLPSRERRSPRILQGNKKVNPVHAMQQDGQTPEDIKFTTISVQGAPKKTKTEQKIKKKKGRKNKRKAKTAQAKTLEHAMDASGDAQALSNINDVDGKDAMPEGSESQSEFSPLTTPQENCPSLLEALEKMKAVVRNSQPSLDQELSPRLLSPALSGISQLSSSTSVSQSQGHADVECSNSQATPEYDINGMFQDVTPPKCKSRTPSSRRLVSSSVSKMPSNFNSLFQDDNIFST